MKRRSLFAGVVLAALAAGTMLLAPGVEAGPNITFGAATITPTTLTSKGGAVNVRVKVTARIVITSVTARATVPGGSASGPTANLVDNGTGRYAGNVVVPSNLGKKAQTSKIFVRVTTSDGSTAERQVGTVKVKANTADPDQPPPPPPI